MGLHATIFLFMTNILRNKDDFNPNLTQGVCSMTGLKMLMYIGNK
jgi:hypothetical protein